MNVKTLTLLALSSAALSGCVGGGSKTAVENRGLESIHQPVVARSDFVFDLPADGGAVYPEDASRLAGWMDALKVGYGDRISIDTSNISDPSGIRRVVNALAARSGLLVETAAPVTSGEIAPGNARVVVSRMRARVDGCSDWSRMGGYDPKGNTSSNFGCSTNRNLSAMVADPSDLVSGKEAKDPASYASRSGAAAKYGEALKAGGGAPSGGGAPTGGAAPIGGGAGGSSKPSNGGN